MMDNGFLLLFNVKSCSISALFKESLLTTTLQGSFVMIVTSCFGEFNSVAHELSIREINSIILIVFFIIIANFSLPSKVS